MKSSTKINPTALLTITQAAERLIVSRRTVFAWIAEGRLRAVRLGRRTTRVLEADVERLIEARTDA